MSIITKKEAFEILKKLIGQPIKYGIKGYDHELYDLGFGDDLEVQDWKGEKRIVCKYTIHSTCEICIVWKDEQKPVQLYYGNTSCDKFHSDFEQIINLCVQHIKIKKKNNLLLDLGECWMEFITFEDEEESWRFFTPYDGPHLVVSNTWLELQ